MKNVKFEGPAFITLFVTLFFIKLTNGVLGLPFGELGRASNEEQSRELVTRNQPNGEIISQITLCIEKPDHSQQRGSKTESKESKRLRTCGFVGLLT